MERDSPMTDSHSHDDLVTVEVLNAVEANRRRAYEIGHTGDEKVKAESYKMFLGYSRWMRLLHDAGCPLSIEAYFRLTVDESGKPRFSMTDMDCETFFALLTHVDPRVEKALRNAGAETSGDGSG